jgi:hypothetical protein
MTNDEYTLSHQEVVKAIIIDQDIHEGLWTLNVNFNVETSHAPRVPNPSLTVIVKGIGIMRALLTDPFAVDAALINPPPQRVEETAEVASAPSTPHRDGGMQFCRDVYRHIEVQSAASKVPIKIS